MIKIIVDCDYNDLMHIRAGGPEILGFTFYINDSDDVNDYMEFIKSELKKNNLPLMFIRYTSYYEREITPSTKETIAECIKKGY